jgi:hypothetical protein
MEVTELAIGELDKHFKKEGTPIFAKNFKNETGISSRIGNHHMKQEMVSKISPQDLIRTIVDAIQTGLYVC